MVHLTVERRDIDGFEGLQEAVKGTHFDVVQLGRGKLNGCISYLGIDDFTLSICAFSEGVCAQRIATDEKILVGMLLGAADRVTQWSFEMLPSDIVVIPPATEHHAVHCGASAYAVIRLDPHELPTIFGGDPWLSDAENWRDKKRHRANPDVGQAAAQGLSRLAHHLSRQPGVFSRSTAEFWRRTIAECMAITINSAFPAADGVHLPSALKLVRQVQDYLETTGDRPLHISELCSTLGVSRRSLHRAFHEIFGIGPVTFLRQKRLCTVHSVLKQSSRDTMTVAEVAVEHGFVELGRFSQQYRLMFGESPSETLSARSSHVRPGREHDRAAKPFRERSDFQSPINGDSTVQPLG